MVGGGAWFRIVKYLSPDIGFKGIGLIVRIPTPPFASCITSNGLLSTYVSVFHCVKWKLLFQSWRAVMQMKWTCVKHLGCYLTHKKYWINGGYFFQASLLASLLLSPLLPPVPDYNSPHSLYGISVVILSGFIYLENTLLVFFIPSGISFTISLPSASSSVHP